LKTVIC